MLRQRTVQRMGSSYGTHAARLRAGLGGYGGAVTGPDAGDRTVRWDDEASRYELLVDGELAGVLDVSDAGDRVVLPHTEIDRRRQGQGLGAVLVAGALDDLRGRGRPIVPTCWYVREFIDRHPDYADLVAT